MNPNFDDNIDKISNIKKKKKSYILSEAESIVIYRNEELNDGIGEYKFIFKNYIGGKIIIYNSIHSFPLNDFNKLIYLFLNIDFETKLNFAIDFHFYSNVLEDDIYLNILSYYGNTTIEKIKEN